MRSSSRSASARDPKKIVSIVVAVCARRLNGASSPSVFAIRPAKATGWVAWRSSARCP